MKKNLQTAIAIHQSGDLEQAETLYLSLLEDDDFEQEELLHLLAILKAQKKELNQALDYIKQALDLDPNNTSFYNSLGNIYKHLKLKDKAIEAYYKAIELNHNAAHQPLNNLGNLLYEQDKLDEAIQHYQSSIRLKPNAPDTYFNLGIALKTQKKQKEAASAFEKTLSFDPNHAGANMELGKFAQENQDYQKAKVYYEQCIQSEPNHLEAKNNLGSVFLAQGDFSQASKTFEQILSFDPKQFEALSNLGNTYLQQRQLNKALHYYLRSIEVQGNFEAYYNLGIIYMYKDQHQDAIDYFKQALVKKPNDINTHTNLGAIYLKLQQKNQASFHYEKILTLNPKHEEAAYLLAALEEKSHFQKAPDIYIQNLFDQYAPYFDAHLKQCLNYQTPQKLFDLLTQHTPPQKSYWKVLDLGCGTGLCGPIFKNFSKELIGIDLSEKMLEVAASKNCYTQLIHDSIEKSLSYIKDVDLLIASDLFPYIGDLETTFDLIFNAIKNKGFFVFSTERSSLPKKQNYQLQNCARFAHSPDYIKSLAEKTGFDLLDFENSILREQNKQSLEGYLWLLKKKAKKQ
jgi:predicted TPR repeat methyltransferase